MADRIVNNMIAWKNEVPWHGKGVEVSTEATGEQMLVAAGMNWHVQRRALAMRDNEGVGLVTNPLTGYRAIVRSDNDHCFQIATDRYHVVQNDQIIDLFREFCDAGHASMETVGGIDNGAIVWALARLNSGTTTKIQGTDELRGYILLATSHDGSIRTIGKATQIRVVCWNTLSAALKGKADFAIKHSTKWTEARAEEAKKALGMAVDQIHNLNEVSAELAKVTINESDWLDFMNRLMGPDKVLDPKDATLTRMAEDIKLATVSSPGSNLVTAKGTLWGAVNGVTYYADHMRGRTQDSRLASAWFGDSDILKRTAVNVAVEMAGLSR